MVTTYYAPVLGGIETHVRQLAAKLMEKGCEVRVVCLARRPGAGRLPPGDENIAGVPITRVRSFGPSEALQWPVRLLEPAQFDVVHFHGFSRLLLIRLTYDAGSVPWVITPHGGVHGAFTDAVELRRHAKGIFDRTVGRWALARASRVIALTEHEAEYFKSRVAVDPARITVIPNALSTEALRVEQGPQGSSQRLLVLSRLEPRKRIADVMMALRSIPAAGRFGCDIAGPDGGELKTLTALSETLPSGSVRFLGPVTGNAKRRLLRESIALLLPSSLEGLSLTALEAIAQGTPVIASDEAAVGLPPEAILTFPAGNVAALASRIASLNDADVVSQLRNGTISARAKIVDDSQQADAVLRAYQNAIGCARV